MTGDSSVFDYVLPIGKVGELLDLLWLLDRGQGDLGGADQEAEARLAVTRTPLNVLSRGIVRHLQGAYSQALSCFEEAWHGVGDPERQAVITALASLGESERDLLPDGRAIPLPECAASGATASVWEERWKHRGAAARSGAAGFIGHLVCDYLRPRGGQRDLATMFRSQGGLSGPPSLLGGLAKLFQLADEIGVAVMHDVVATEIAYLWALAGWNEDALKALDDLRGAYEEVEDRLGAASVALLRGDVLATPPPLGPPMVFGYSLRSPADLADSSLQIPPNDVFDRSKIRVEDARRAYQEARDVYTELRASRGAGAADLRLAYLEAAVGNVEAASRGYRHAERALLAAGDHVNAGAAFVGRVWTGLLRGLPISALTRAAQGVAQRARSEGATARGIGWGLVFLEAAKEAVAVRGDVEGALRATRIAEAIFASLDAPLRRAACCALRAEALLTVEALDDATVELQEACHWYRTAGARSEPEREQARAAGLTVAGTLVQLQMQQEAIGWLRHTAEGVRELVDDLPDPSPSELKTALAAQRRSAEAALALADPHAAAELTPAELATALDAGARVRQVIRAGALRALAQWVERQARFQVAYQRGRGEMEAGRGSTAALAFREAIDAARAMPDGDYFEALVYSQWERYADAKAALRRYVAAKLPSSSEIVSQIAGALPFEPAAAGRVAPSKSRYLPVAQAYANIDDWISAREAYSAAGVDLEALPDTQADRSQAAILNHILIARIAHGTGSPDAALRRFQAVAAIADARLTAAGREQFRRSFSEQRLVQRLYADWANVLAESGRWEDAFQVVERARARALAEALAESRALRAQVQDLAVYRRRAEQLATIERLTSLLSTELRKIPADKARLQELYADRARAQCQLDELDAELARATPRLSALRPTRAPTATLSQIAARLPEGTALLAYHFFDRTLLAWAVSRDGLVATHRADRFAGKEFRARRFASEVLHWTRELAGGREQPERTTALSQLLIDPFERVIRSARHILIVPYAELNMVPLHALPWGGEALGLQRTVSYLPAVTVLSDLGAHAHPGKGALFVGDPTGMSFRFADSGLEALNPLPGARLEAIATAAAYRAKGLEIKGSLVGADATEKRVRAALKGASLVHLATHACLQPGAPLDSGIALAGGSALTVDEIIGISLDAETIILSACDTARGGLQGSDLIGFARGLLIAGAKTLLVSLWSAGDVPTLLIMNAFHQHLLSGQKPGAALMESQRWLSKVTAGEALERIEELWASLSERERGDAQLQASYEWCVGEVRELGGDELTARDHYLRAAARYRKAGRPKEAIDVESYAEPMQGAHRSAFESDRPVFADAGDWAPFVLIGEW